MEGEKATRGGVNGSSGKSAVVVVSMKREREYNVDGGEVLSR